MRRREDSAKFFASCAAHANSNCAPATSAAPGNACAASAEEVERVASVLRVARRRARGDERAHRPLALRERAAHLFERGARRRPTASRARSAARGVQRFGARRRTPVGDGAEDARRCRRAARVEGGDARRGRARSGVARLGEAREGVGVGVGGFGVALRVARVRSARVVGLFGVGGRGRRVKTREGGRRLRRRSSRRRARRSRDDGRRRARVAGRRSARRLWP